MQPGAVWVLRLFALFLMLPDALVVLVVALPLLAGAVAVVVQTRVPWAPDRPGGRRGGGGAAVDVGRRRQRLRQRIVPTATASAAL